MTAKTSSATAELTFLDFVSAQERNLMVSLTKFPEELKAFQHVEGLYHAAIGKAAVPDGPDKAFQDLVCQTHANSVQRSAAEKRRYRKAGVPG